MDDPKHEQVDLSDFRIDLPDPTTDERRYLPRTNNPSEPRVLPKMIQAAGTRIGVGRAGPRVKTTSLLLFQGDHAVTQDALYRDIDQDLLDEFELFSVQTSITGGKEEYLLRPDLGRRLSERAKQTIAEKCEKRRNIQIAIGDGLSSAAVEANLAELLPAIQLEAVAAGLTVGTPFHIRYCRVGVMNDIGELLEPDVLILLIGERPGLGRANSLSVYMGYKPETGKNDADRDVISNIFADGGTNPREAAKLVVDLAKRMRQYQASGVKLKIAAQQN